jgi:hypothetical protein
MRARRCSIPPPLDQCLAVLGGSPFLFHCLLYRHGLYRWVRRPLVVADGNLDLGLTLLTVSGLAIALHFLGLYLPWKQARVEDQPMAGPHPEQHRLWKRHTGRSDASLITPACHCNYRSMFAQTD